MSSASTSRRRAGRPARPACRPKPTPARPARTPAGWGSRPTGRRLAAPPAWTGGPARKTRWPRGERSRAGKRGAGAAHPARGGPGARQPRLVNQDAPGRDREQRHARHHGKDPPAVPLPLVGRPIGHWFVAADPVRLPTRRRRPKAPVPASSSAPAAPTAIQGASSELVAARPPVPALTADTDPPRAV